MTNEELDEVVDPTGLSEEDKKRLVYRIYEKLIWDLANER